MLWNRILRTFSLHSSPSFFIPAHTLPAGARDDAPLAIGAPGVAVVAPARWFYYATSDERQEDRHADRALEQRHFFLLPRRDNLPAQYLAQKWRKQMAG